MNQKKKEEEEPTSLKIASIERKKEQRKTNYSDPK